jgi:hypothetical protein
VRATLYRYVNNEPTDNNDPVGLEDVPALRSSSSKQKLRPQKLGKGEHWLEDNKHELGIMEDKDTTANGNPNCVGACLGKPKVNNIDYKPGYVPRGCVEVSLKNVSLSSSPCTKSDLELIVLFAFDKKKKAYAFLHSIARNPGKLPSAWHTKMGRGGGIGEGAYDSGAWVRDIRDPKGHMQWYFKQLESTKGKVMVIKVYCCNSKKLVEKKGDLQLRKGQR